MPDLPAETRRYWRVTAAPPSLVCPFDLGELQTPTADVARCPHGHVFPVIGGVADLAVIEDPRQHAHHKPDRSLKTFPTYEERRSERRSEPSARRFGGALRELWELSARVREWRQFISRAVPSIEQEALDTEPRPPDRFADIHGPGLYAHEALKRLEKEVFWDHQELRSPSCELGVADGRASRYFFEGRQIDFGTEFLVDRLLVNTMPYGVRFAANAKFLPLPDASLETVFCAQTVTCIHASVVTLLAEVNRVLRPGGRFVFTTHGPGYLRGLPVEGWPALGLSADDCVRRNAQRSSYMTHLYTRDEWQQLLAATGFAVAETRGILSLDLAKYQQLLYFAENAGPNPFRETYRRGRLGLTVRSLFGGRRAYQRYDAQYRAIMQRVVAHDLAEHRGAEFDSRRFLDAGIVAIKHGPVPVGAGRLVAATGDA